MASPSASVTGTCAATVFDESSVSWFAVVEALLPCVDVFVVMVLDGGVTATHVAATSSIGSPSMAVEQMVKLVTCGVRPVAAAGGARAECTLADFDRTYGVGRIGRIFKGDGDWFVRMH